MKTLAELDKIKNETLKKIQFSSNKEGMRVVVGMATCGLAAGARPVKNALLEELKKRKIDNVEVATVGCIGVCRLEPIVEVIDSKGRRVTYVNMSAEKAKRIVAEHIVNGRPCLEYTIGEADKR